MSKLKINILQDNIDSIKELVDSKKEKRLPNKNILSKYKGFGAIPEILRDINNPLHLEKITPIILRDKIIELHQLIKSSLRNNQEQYQSTINSLKTSKLSSFYTSEEIVKSLYDNFIKDFDIKNNKVLDPSAGIGTFTNNIINADITSIEKDRITAAILQQLKNNKKNISLHSTFEKYSENNNNDFDLVISNFPFGNIKVLDSLYYKKEFFNKKSYKNDIRKNSLTKIHDYFILRSIDSLKNNGRGVFITSTGTADAINENNDNIRKEIISTCKLETLIRLPNNTFTDTKVNSDIYVLTKREKELDIENLKDNELLTQIEKDFLNVNKITLANNDGINITSNINSIFWKNEKTTENLIGIPTVDYFNNKETIVYVSTNTITEIASEINNIANKITLTKPGHHQNKEVKEKVKISDYTYNKTLEEIAKFKKGDICYDEKTDELLIYQSEGNYKLLITDNLSNKASRKAKDYHKLIYLYDKLIYETIYAIDKTPYHIRESIQMNEFIESFDQFIKDNYNIDNINFDNWLYQRENIQDFHETIFNNNKIDDNILNGNIIDWRGFIKKEQQEKSNIVSQQIDLFSTLTPEDNKEKDNSLSKEQNNPKIEENLPDLEDTIIDEQPTDLSLKDSILRTLNEVGRIDLDIISSYSGLTINEVINNSLQEGLLYPNPKLNFVSEKEEYQPLNPSEAKFTLVPKDEFLSGAVRHKIKELEQNGINYKYVTELQLQDYLAELNLIVKPRLNIHEISANLGESWIPVHYFEDFANELFESGSIKILKQESQMEFKVDFNYSTYEMNNTYAVTRKSGQKIRGTKLLEMALVGSSPNFRHTETYSDGSKVSYPDTKAIAEAITKINQINEKWQNFISSNEEIANELENIYNNQQNLIQSRIYDGSHLEFPGLEHFEPREHQKDGVWQLINQGGGLADHAVGAGKTLMMAMQTMEMKRLKISNKTIILAMKANTTAIAEEFQKAYPNAKILHPTDKDIKKENREKFFSKMTEDYDAIIMTHDQFKMIPQSREVELELINEEIENLTKDLETLENATGKAATGRQLTGLQKRIENKEAKLEELLLSITKDPNLLSFDKMGIDHIMVDESQVFKNLPFTTRHSQVSGLGSPEGSQRAFNLLIAVRTIQKKFDSDKGITFFSGTPISNSLVELYLIFKYLQPSELERRGMTNFDEWARTYALVDRDFELSVTNEIKQKERFRYFLKAPELSTMYRLCANVITDDELKIDKPKLNIINVVDKLTPTQEKAMQELISAAKKKDFSYFGYKHKDEDAARKASGLLATTFASKIALDMRLIDPNYSQEDGSKVNKVCENVINEYIRSDEDKGTQFIFLDQSTPTSKTAKEFNMYDSIKTTLIEKYGIDENQIEFIHDHDTKKKREQLFKKVNNGDVRIVIGSTTKMGTGVNMQERCIAMHHVDIPWNPAPFTQRNGRGARQGNLIAKKYGNLVNTYVYTTEKTLDGYKYSLMTGKDRFIQQIKKNSDFESRILDEKEMDEDGGMNITTLISILSGQPELMEKAKVDKKLAQLKEFKNATLTEIKRLKVSINKLELGIPKLKERGKVYHQDSLEFKKHFKFDAENKNSLNKISYKLKDSKGDVIEKQDNIRSFYKELIEQKIMNPTKIASIGAFDVKIIKELNETFDEGIFKNQKSIDYPLVIESNITGEIYKSSSQNYFDMSPQVNFTLPFYVLQGLERKAEKQFNMADDWTKLLDKEKNSFSQMDATKWDKEITELTIKSSELQKKIEDQTNQIQNELDGENSLDIKDEQIKNNETSTLERNI